eukprot:Ihof_evm8s274 gene=Ihof_evmTU8s274
MLSFQESLWLGPTIRLVVSPVKRLFRPLKPIGLLLKQATKDPHLEMGPPGSLFCTTTVKVFQLLQVLGFIIHEV